MIAAATHVGATAPSLRNTSGLLGIFEYIVGKGLRLMGYEVDNSCACPVENDRYDEGLENLHDEFAKKRLPVDLGRWLLICSRDWFISLGVASCGLTGVIDEA